MNSVYIADHDWHQWGLTFWLNGKLILGSLSNYEDNVNVRKQMVLWSKQQLCTCITLFSTFLKLTSSAPLRRETSQCDVFNRTWTYDDKFSFSLFEHVDKVFKNSAPGKVAYIWQIERFQIDAKKFERTQINSFFSAMFSLPSSSLLLKLSNCTAAWPIERVIE